jgi:hypothetical protein
MSVASDSDAEMRLYDRLGPRVRAAIGNAHRVINIAKCLARFQSGREPIERDGDLYPAPAYNSPEGDAEFARWIDDNVIRKDVGKSLADLVIGPIRTGIVTKQAQRLSRALGRVR